MKWILRLLGFCGHEYKWEPVITVTLDGKKTNGQQGICERCGAANYREAVCL